jgi:hypothetical protein
LFTRMEVVSAQSGAPDLPLGRGFMPYNDPIQIRGIDGLGPVKSDLALTPFATGRGEVYQGISTGKRNIVLTLGLNPNWVDYTMMSLRQLLYRYFMPERWATLRFFSDELPSVYINGVVESFEPNMFAQDPEIQISLICPKPDFIDMETSWRSGTTDGSETFIDYIGTVPVGFVLLLAATEEVPTYTGSLRITNTVGDRSQTFSANSVSVDLATDMYVEINTVKTTRHMYNVAGDEAANILGKLNSGSVWLELSPGQNTFVVAADEPGLKWSLGYFNRFGGL